MTTHLRGRATQAGAFLALVAGLVAGVQTAALADAPSVKISAPSSGDSGSTVTVQYTVGNPGPTGGTGDAVTDTTVSASLSGGSCNSGCGDKTVKIEPGKSSSFSATIVLPSVGQGQSQQVTFQVSASTDGQSTSQSATITVKGPEAPKETTVRQVSGKVKAGDGTRLAGATVGMRDSAGHQYSTSTNGNGEFAFTSSDGAPIAAGSITVGATMDGYKAARTTVKGVVGKSVTATVTLKALAASPSATPSASASASASTAATDEALEEEEPTDEAPTNQTNTLAGDTKSASEDSGGSSWLLIIMGGLLVAAGVGAMVLVWLRRKNAANNDDSDGGLGLGAGPGPSSSGPGRYGDDATRVAAPVGAGRGNDATMVAGAGMGAGAARLSDAPTMIHRPPVEDEFPDPYGAPIPPQGGFLGADNGQWDNQGGGGYGAGAGDNFGGATGTYGAQQAGGYDNGTQRYDEHTSMYQPEQPAQRYDEHTSMYQPGNGGYDDQAGYGGGYGAGQGGYEQGGGYPGQSGAGWGDQGGNGDGYGPQGGNYGGGYEQGGYAQPGGYAGQGGYDQGGYGTQGYDQHGGAQGAGYDQGGYGTQGGYDQRGGAYGQDPDRRNRDWEG